MNTKTLSELLQLKHTELLTLYENCIKEYSQSLPENQDLNYRKLCSQKGLILAIARDKLLQIDSTSQEYKDWASLCCILDHWYNISTKKRALLLFRMSKICFNLGENHDSRIPRPHPRLLEE